MHLFENLENLILYFSELQNYDDIEIIAQRFEKAFNAKVVNKLDGPYLRIWDLQIENEIMQLVADDPYGSSLRALSDSSRSKLKELMPLIATIMN